MTDDKPVCRCGWCGSDPLYVAYHDREWGVPNRDDRHLFEMLVLEGAQAGLSWLTILRKREGYRRAFDNFDLQRVAAYTDADRQRLLSDPGIVRNRLKIDAAIVNAQAVLKVIEEFGSFDGFIWGLAGGEPRQNCWQHLGQIPARTPESDAMSRELRLRGFKFVGSTICYSLMQAVGMVNDHLVDCFRYRELVSQVGGSDAVEGTP